MHFFLPFVARARCSSLALQRRARHEKRHKAPPQRRLLRSGVDRSGASTEHAFWHVVSDGTCAGPVTLHVQRVVTLLPPAENCLATEALDLVSPYGLGLEHPPSPRKLLGGCLTLRRPPGECGHPAVVQRQVHKGALRRVFLVLSPVSSRVTGLSSLTACAAIKRGKATRLLPNPPPGRAVARWFPRYLTRGRTWDRRSAPIRPAPCDSSSTAQGPATPPLACGKTRPWPSG